MKKLNCPVSGKLNRSFSSAEITRTRTTPYLNLKQKVNQSTPEELLMLTGFVKDTTSQLAIEKAICES